MLKAVTLLLTFFFFFFFRDSHQQCFTVNDAVAYVGPENVTAYVESRNNFSVSLFKLIDKERNQNNVIFSPSSVHEALLVAYFGAARDTEASLFKVLQLPKDQSKGLIWRIFDNQYRIKKRIETDDYPFKNVLKLYISSKLRLRSCMQQKFKKIVELIDYQKDVVRAQSHINKWIEKQTEGKITDYIEHLSPKSTATLISSVSFRGLWLHAFSTDETQYIPFRVNTYETRRISMMVKRSVFDTGRHPKIEARTLMLPYEGNRTAMIIVLPDRELETTMALLNAKTIEHLFNKRHFRPTYMKVFIPKFEHRHKMEIGKIMETLGIGNTFTKFADFSGFTGRKEIFLDNLTHEGVIQVDEEGTAAAEVGHLKHSHHHRSNARPFMCDRPFVYIVYDFMTRKILLMGTFRDPQKVIDD